METQIDLSKIEADMAREQAPAPDLFKGPEGFVNAEHIDAERDSQLRKVAVFVAGNIISLGCANMHNSQIIDLAEVYKRSLGREEV